MSPRQESAVPVPEPRPPQSRAATSAKRRATASRPGRDGLPPGHGPPATVPSRKPSRRLWSARRIPAAFAALVVLFCAVMLLFDVVRVRAGQPAAAWRNGLFDELASRPLDDVWMLAGAAAAAALGVWLIVLALTPGLRRRLPLQVPAGRGRTRATLDRDSAAQLLRDTALRVPGVSGARVRVRRHRTRVRADVRFRDPREVRSEIVAAVRDEQRNGLALAHPPKLSVRARRTT